jgi:hypothetical protein
MERKTNKNGSKPLWKKVTTGTLVLRVPKYFRIKHNQLVEASIEELGNRLDSDFELVKDGTGKFKVHKEKGKSKAKAKGKKAEVIDLPKDLFGLEERGDGLFDVVSAAGKVMNAEALEKEKAEELRDQLEG